MKIFTHWYRIVIFKDGRFCWIVEGWDRKKKALTFTQRWNRLKVCIAHIGKRFEHSKASQEHLKECSYCKNDFQKWLDKNKE